MFLNLTMGAIPFIALLNFTVFPLTVDAKSVSRKASDKLVSKQRLFEYKSEEKAYVIIFDTRKVNFGIIKGLGRELEAYNDEKRLAYFSGPMYEETVESNSKKVIYPLGDMKFGRKMVMSRNRAAAIERAYIGIKYNGIIHFSYGELTSKRARVYKTFIGGLHSIYNDIEAEPLSYKGAYDLNLSQKIRYYLPRVRMLYGLRNDGRLEVLMSKRGLTLEETTALARKRNLVAAYLPDHASKSRLIVPKLKSYSEQNDRWNKTDRISDKSTPYMINIQRRRFILTENIFSLEQVNQLIFGRNSYKSWLQDIASLPNKGKIKAKCMSKDNCFKGFLSNGVNKSVYIINRSLNKIIRSKK